MNSPTYGATPDLPESAQPSEPTPPPAPTSWVSSLWRESGLGPLTAAPLSAHILIAQRFLRMVAYGQSTLILVLFFQALGTVSEPQIGLFMTLTLVGDVLMSYFLTLYADGWGRRKVLAWSSFLMLVSGVVFATSENFYWLLLAAIVGVVSPSGDETGPFKSIEESTLAHLTAHEFQPDIFAWYGLLGTFGGAVGSLSGGVIVDYLTEKYSAQHAYKTVFWIYAGLAGAKLVLTLFLSKDCEFEYKDGDALEQSRLLHPQSPESEEPTPAAVTEPLEKKDWIHYIFGKPLSKESKPIVLRLLAFFGFDALGYGFLVPSWLVVYFTDRFGINATALGSLLFTTTVVGSFSSLLSASLYRRVGPIKAMVFTHLPSALFAAAIPLAGSHVQTAMLLLLCRAATNSMDVVPRTAFLSAVVKPDERTRVMGMVNIVKTFMRSIGPLVVGKLAAEHLLWLSFIIGGLLEATYDVGLFSSFYWIDAQFKNRS